MGFNDDGLGQAMAESGIRDEARRAQSLAEDSAAILKWLVDRVAALEAQAGIAPEPMPELPSAIARREQALRAEMLRQSVAQMRGQYSNAGLGPIASALLGTRMDA